MNRVLTGRIGHSKESRFPIPEKRNDILIVVKCSRYLPTSGGHQLWQSATDANLTGLSIPILSLGNFP